MDSELNHAILQGELVLQVNSTRSLYDLFGLRDPFLADFTAALNDAKQWNSAAIFAEGDTSGAQARLDGAREKLRGLLRNGYYGILAVMDEDIQPGDRQNALVSYGWEGGNIGDLESVERVEALALLSVTAGTHVAAALRYPAALQSRITNWLGVVNGSKLIANGGQRATVILQKDNMRELLLKKLARVRFLYCAASDLGEFSPELERISFQRRRAPGEAQGQALPDAAGTATWNAGATTLALAAMPAHATFLVAFRQPLGGQPEEAGVSTTETVAASQFSPFVPGATYDLWVVGRNSRGDGVASAKIRWTAPL
jgi:hypothetical protein